MIVHRQGDHVADLLRVDVGLGLAEERAAVGLGQGQRGEALAVDPGVALGVEDAVLLVRQQELQPLEQCLARGRR